MATIEHHLTPEQQDVLDGLFNPFVSARSSGEGADVHACVIRDDNLVETYVIAADGSYTCERLNGFGQGWSEV